ncbi:hypothetical protein FZI93_26090 [Mycobacterium sp. CBMA361]|nr:hypothetical protein [Mycolicibacterium sp. CBMA 361]
MEYTGVPHSRRAGAVRQTCYSTTGLLNVVQQQSCVKYDCSASKLISVKFAAALDELTQKLKEGSFEAVVRLAPDTPPPPDQAAIDTGWRIFTALCDWNGKVDTKAAFTMTIDTAVIAGVVALTHTGEHFAKLTGPALHFLWVGTILTALSALCAALVVSPILRPQSELYDEAQKGSFIYFGHLASLEKADIKDRLTKFDVLDALSHELVNASKNAWVKHRLTQVALFLVAVGGVFLLVTVPAHDNNYAWGLLAAIPAVFLVFAHIFRRLWWNRLKP